MESDLWLERDFKRRMVQVPQTLGQSLYIYTHKKWGDPLKQQAFDIFYISINFSSKKLVSKLFSAMELDTKLTWRVDDRNGSFARSSAERDEIDIPMLSR